MNILSEQFTEVCYFSYFSSSTIKYCVFNINPASNPLKYHFIFTSLYLSRVCYNLRNLGTAMLLFSILLQVTVINVKGKKGSLSLSEEMTRFYKSILL